MNINKILVIHVNDVNNFFFLLDFGNYFLCSSLTCKSWHCGKFLGFNFILFIFFLEIFLNFGNYLFWNLF